MNEAIFRIIFEQSPFSIQILTTDGRTVAVNHAFEQLWGLTLEQLADYNMLHDEQLVAKGVMPYLRRGFAGEAVAMPPILYDSRLTLQNGKRRWVRAFMHPLKNAAGQLENVILVHEDITQRMRTGEALYKSKEQLAAVLDALSDSITVQDKGGNIVYANIAAARLMGFASPGAMLEAASTERLARFTVFDEYGDPFPLDSLPGRRVMRGEGENSATLRFVMAATGDEYWAVVRAVPVFDAQGDLSFAISIFHDITARKQTERERLHLMVQIESERALLEAVLHQLPVGVLIVDMPSGKMMLGNEQFSRIWRYPTEAFISYAEFRQGKGFYPGGEPLTSEDWPLARVMATGDTARDEEIDILRGDGTRGTVQAGAAPVRDASGKLIAAVATLTDVTEVKQAEDRIRFQARLLDTVGQAVVATDLEGRIFYWNHAAEAMFGWTSVEVLGRDILQVLPSVQPYATSEALMNNLRQGQGWQGETEVRHRDGHKIPLITAVSSVFDENGRVLGMIGTSTDLTARKKEEMGQRLLAQAGAVLSSTLNYTETLESVARLAVPTLADWCAVDMLDEQGKVQRLAVTHVDPEKIAWAYDLSKRFPSNINSPIGVPYVLRTGLSELTPKITDELLAQNIENTELLETIRSLGLHSSLIVPLCARGRTLGAITFIFAESNRHYDQSDLELAEELARRAGLAVDNARLYQEAQAARDAAEIANRAKDEFLATLSHELRTPLTSMVGWTDLLRSGLLSPEDRNRALDVIARSTQTQTRLIEDLLDVSRIITGKLQLQMQPVQLYPIIEAAAETARPTAATKKLKFRFETNDPTLTVAGDEARLQQVIWNLLSNAVKFTPPGGTITVTLSAENNNAKITVHDTGKGIAAEFLPFVFDRFRQADSSSTRNYGGLGLGLSIVRHLVEMHGGSVGVQSEGENRGATFTVILPLLNETKSAE